MDPALLKTVSGVADGGIDAATVGALRAHGHRTLPNLDGLTPQASSTAFRYAARSSGFSGLKRTRRTSCADEPGWRQHNPPHSPPSPRLLGEGGAGGRMRAMAGELGLGLARRVAPPVAAATPHGRGAGRGGIPKHGMMQGMAEQAEIVQSELARLREENARLAAKIEQLKTALGEALERIRKLERGRKQHRGS